MTQLGRLLVDRRRRERKFFDSPYYWTRQIKRVLSSQIDDVRVFLFGSVLRGESRPGSDIDILVYSPQLPDRQSERVALTASLNDLLGLVHPFELHFANDREFAWYRHFADMKEVE